jgi:glycosyltransferase involved in cell wall biosynthesis
MKISVVINTLNEEQSIEKALKSVSWADEVVVCDMHSEDKTAEIAKQLGAKVVSHKRMGYVEPARNFAIGQTKGDWILILDADEEISESLTRKLQKVVSENQYDLVEIPRKNIIFGKWMEHSMWWPDPHIRFFKKGSVTWRDEIHSKPVTKGEMLQLALDEDLAIIHHHYTNMFQYLERMNRYTTIQAKELKEGGYTFEWSDVMRKPLGEFLSRYFAHRGFEDGLHGLALALLQAFSHVVMYLKVWEFEGFEKKSLKPEDVEKVVKEGGKEINYWFKYGNISDNPVKNLLQRVKNKIS